MSLEHTSVSPENKPSLWPIALRYGLIAALITIAVGLALQMAGLVDPSGQQQGMSAGNWISSLINIAVMVGAAVMAVNLHRDTNLGGWVSFGQAFRMAMAVFVIISLITAVWTGVYIGMINTDLLDIARERAYEQAGEMPEGSEKMMNMFLSPWFFAVSTFFVSLLLGLVIALVIALVMKKEPNTGVM